MRQKVFTILITFFVVVSSTKTKAIEQETQIALTNVAFGAIVATIGSIINHADDEKWYQNLPKAFFQGALGGLVGYFGKKMTENINTYDDNTGEWRQNLYYAWPAKLIHAAGQSIIDNAAQNREWWESYKLDLYATRLEFDFTSFDFKARWLPFATVGIVQGFIEADFELKETLITGTPYFTSDKHDIFGYPAYSTFKNAILAYNRDSFFFPHELIHTFQYSDFNSINSFLLPLDQKLKSKSYLYEIFSSYIYLDLPYWSLFYELEGRRPNGSNYLQNYFEFEAERLSSGSNVLRD